MAGKKDSYLAITAISVLTVVIGILVYYLLRVHVPPQLAPAAPAEEDEDPRKAARRAQREAARRQREELLREQEEKRAVLEEQKAKKEDERLKREQDELEKKLKEYHKWRAQMKVVSSRERPQPRRDVTEEEIRDFIKANKRVEIDELSLHFSLPIPVIRERVLGLSFQGIVDDFGTCIYVTDEELVAVRALELSLDAPMAEIVAAVNQVVSMR